MKRFLVLSSNDMQTRTKDTSATPTNTLLMPKSVDLSFKSKEGSISSC